MFQFVPGQVAFFHQSATHSIFQRFGVSSSASPETADKEHGSAVDNNGAPNTSGDAELSDQAGQSKAAETKESGQSQSTLSESVKRRRKVTKRTAFSDSDSESEDELSMEYLIKLVGEKDELLKLKHQEIEKAQDKVLRTYAEMENVMDRTRREAENSKKFAIQVSFFYFI
jgi:molecular chaperone GrpE